LLALLFALSLAGCGGYTKADIDSAYEAGEWMGKKIGRMEAKESVDISDVATVWEDYKYDTSGYVYMETWRYEELIDNLQSIAKVTDHYWDQGYVPVEYVDGYLSNINLSDIYDY
jgi:hypothetical protein